MLEEIADFIARVGFPIFVSIWLLIEKKELKEVLRQNTAALQRSADVMVNCPKKKE